MRTQAAKEILTTEESYVQSLDLFCSVYVLPLQILSRDPASVVLTDEEWQTLFSNIMVIMNLNREFLDKLSPPITNFASDTCLAPYFLSFAPFFKMSAA